MAILIIGKTGFIGSYYYKYSKIKEKKFFTSSKNKKYYNLNLIKFNKNKLSNFIKEKKIKKVVVLSSISKPEDCFRNKKNSYAINVKGTKNLINLLIKHGVYFIFFSTEYIFDGTKGYYTEKSKAIPSLYYGKQKLIIEDYIKLKSYKNFAISKSYLSSTSIPCCFETVIDPILQSNKCCLFNIFFGLKTYIKLVKS